MNSEQRSYNTPRSANQNSSNTSRDLRSFSAWTNLG